MNCRYSLILFSFLALPFYGNAQLTKAERDSIYIASKKDHQLMLKLLKIEALRPGPSGDPTSPDAANSDESKANNYDSLPDPLTFRNGNPVKSETDWNKRREEVLEDFNSEVYGYTPENIPEVKWIEIYATDSIVGNVPVRYRKLQGVVDNSGYPEITVCIDLSYTLPITEKPAPLILKFDWIWPGMKIEEKEWQKLLLENGYGYARLIPTSYQADNGAGLRQGIIGLINKGKPRDLQDWGTLKAWAWGASKCLDLFESDEMIDEKRVGIEGLSRYGKAAMVTMAYDERFAIGFIGSAGAGGTSLLRRNFGEQIENLVSTMEYHWFAPKFIKYGGPLTAADLPVDAHQLIALAAPRPVFISTGDPSVEGNWVDAKGMFLASYHASPVYELYGFEGLTEDQFPGVGEFLDNGRIAFRTHEGGHTVEPNWPYFIEFANSYLKSEN